MGGAIMYRAVLAVLLSICCVAPASAASFEELTPYLSTQYFTWREYSDQRRILKEKGELFTGGIVVGALLDSSLTLRGKAELFGGEVDYDGETQQPDPVPVQTDVTYFGILTQIDAGYRITSGSLRLEPFAGVGYRAWMRDLQDSTSASGARVNGYTESWQTGYGRLGARARYLSPAGFSLFAEGGAMYPFYTGNSVDFEGSGTTTFKPRGRASGFAETGAAWKQLRLALYYQGYRWSASPLKTVQGALFYQPESSSDIVGLSFGWAFR